LGFESRSSATAMMSSPFEQIVAVRREVSVLQRSMCSCKSALLRKFLAMIAALPNGGFFCCRLMSLV
jgi:hypothetical protein